MNASRARTEEPELAEVVLITGYPGFVAKRLVTELLIADSTAELRLIVRSDGDSRALASLGQNVSALLGDVSAMDLGLSGSEYQQLVARVTTIHHLAQAPIRDTGRDEAQRTNVDGTRQVLRLAGECKKLRRMCHWSSVAVAGKRKGVILEEDLDHEQSFHNFTEQTLFEAEKLVRAAMHRIPATVFRPGLVVGDSESGEIEGQDGPYYLMSLIANGPHNFPIPIPGGANAPLHVVPVDFVVRAAVALSRDTRSAGETYHLTDPNPLPARRVFELLAEHANTKIAKHSLPSGIAKTLLRAPGLEKLSRAPRAFLDRVDQQVFFNSRRACELLADHGVQCPSFDNYAADLVRFLRAHPVAKPDQGVSTDADDTIDPFD